MENVLVPPHGGKLINRRVTGSEAQKLLEMGQDLPKINLTNRSLADLECIATGIYSPLTGFMNQEDYLNVVRNMRLANGLVWTVPITLPVTEKIAETIDTGSQISLCWDDQVIAIMDVSSKFIPDKKMEAEMVYKTTNSAHPGVNALMQSGNVYLGGDITLIADIPHKNFLNERLTPEQTRSEFKKRGWRTIVAFQTRNPIHRAHEYIQKVALETVDGLFLNPLVGETKSDDIPADIRMEAYKTILEKYYPLDRVVLGVYPAAMRYAGPREAVLHAISRQNYGCSHFIVGRDHAGVGKYYGTYDAQKIFDLFEPSELGIQPLKFEHAFFCTVCDQMATAKTCPHSKENHVFLSGTKVRAMLFEGQLPPKEFTRPEVAQVLMNSMKPKEMKSLKGVTVWFTGLSGAGKSTIAKNLSKELEKLGIKYEILDGDIIRQNLTKGLGFSKEDRDENIRRIGFVAGLLTRNNVVVIVAAISPYREIRDEVRQKIGNFVEVYVNAPIEVCEQRDVKGLYKRARAGEIKNFTGIDDPYEPPTNPEVVCHTDQETVEESTKKVLDKLIELGYIGEATPIANLARN